jgi:hypothetical protein
LWWESANQPDDRDDQSGGKHPGHRKTKDGIQLVAAGMMSDNVWDQ